MKILYVVQNYFPSVGGTQILFQNIAERCRQLFGDEGEVLTVDSYLGPDKSGFKKIEKKHEVINNISVQRFSFYQFHYWTFNKIIKLLGLFKIKVPQFIKRYRSGPWSPSLKRALNSTNADVILGSSSNYLYMLYPLYRHKLKNPKPFIFQGAIHFSEDPSKEVIFRKTLQAIKASDYYIANTQFEKDKLVDLGVSSDSIIVCGIGVDLENYAGGNRDYFRNKLGIQENDILVGYIGRIEATKDIDILILAMDVVVQNHANIFLVIAGFEAEYARKLESLADEFSKRNNNKIHFLYNISFYEKVNLYHALDIYVLPSKNESFGMVFLEAWACHRPVIGARIGAIKSVISEGEDGLLFEPENVNELSQKIIELAMNCRLRKSLAYNGFKKTETNYSWITITKKYRDVFLMAINKYHVQRGSNLD